MTKGKYATKAINRLAAVDNEVIVELRAKLQSAEATNRVLAEEVSVLTRRLNGTVTQEAAMLAQEEIARLADELRDQHSIHAGQVESLAFNLLDLYSEHNCHVGEGGNAEKFNTEFAALFGMSDRAGELMDYIHRNEDEWRDDNRHSRRATSTAKKIRHQRSRLLDTQRNPGAFRSKQPKNGLYYGRVEVRPEDMGLPR